ncbi:hypothetical protein C8Q74DRAFT_1271904 [Fomes fomentarius]|nr:hypothetical protein C8Q74DRAFT_1271904 [Fomes fomentarius]
MIVPVFLLFLTAVHALVPHVPRAELPTIIEPTSQSLWRPGGINTVRWITQNLDLEGLNGTIVLGHFVGDGTPFLWNDQLLAENVSLADGAVNVRCPFNVPYSQRYLVALLGEGGNSTLSAPFTIQDINFNTSSTAFPTQLSTSGGVPSATITRTSVVGTIPPRSTSTTDSSSSSSASTGSPTPTAGSNGSQVMADVRLGIVACVVALPVLFSGF